MYSPGLKKLGEELGLTAEKGRVYGVFEGFPVTMWDGAGTKNLLLVFGEPGDNAQETRIDLAELLPRELEAYRIQELHVDEDAPLVSVVFFDNPGTLKRMRAFLQEALPAFRKAGLSRHYRCVQCGEKFQDGVEIALAGGAALPVHRHCEAELHGDMEAQKRADALEIRRQSAEALRDGTTLKGVLGAIIGGLVGAIPWVVLYMLGYVAALGGVFIGAGAVYGYKKLSGRAGVACVISAVIVTVVMVFLATLAGDAADTARLILTGELAEINGLPAGTFNLGDLGWYQGMLYESPEWREGFRANLLQGYAYAAIGLILLLLRVRHGLRARVDKKTAKDA